MKRKIMHADINHCFAQILEMMHPHLKEVPMAVAGNSSERHGIILARNLKAKKAGVKTAQAIHEAKKLCPDIVLCPPNYELFKYYSDKVKDIYREYSDCVESFGMDEAWVDLTHSQRLFGPAEDIAKTIQNRVYSELGLTISIGLSFNKIFSKLASDLVKPSGFVVINEDNFKEIVWPLPVEDLLMVGYKTKEKLNKQYLFCIGDIAQCTQQRLKRLLGKHGTLLWHFANGLYDDNVLHQDIMVPYKSIGHSFTPCHNLNNITETMLVLQTLAQEVARRLKLYGQQGNVICVSLRDTDLHSITRQKKIPYYTNLYQEILTIAKELIVNNYTFNIPLRSVGVSVTNLKDHSNSHQLNFFIDQQERHKQYQIESVIDSIRTKFGHDKIKMLSAKLDPTLNNYKPNHEHCGLPSQGVKL